MDHLEFTIDLPALLKPVPGDQPGGPALTGDPIYVELERNMNAKPAMVPGEETPPIDWRAVNQQAMTLINRSKDLQLAVYLTAAQVRLRGVFGLRDSLALILGLLNDFWETVHPQLDPTDANDPLVRVNTLLSLCPPDGQFVDNLQIGDAVREAPLCSSRVGQFSLRAVLIARGKEAPAPGKTVPPVATVELAFKESKTETLTSVADALRLSGEHLASLQVVLAKKGGPDATIDTKPLRLAISEALALVNKFLEGRGGAAIIKGEPDQDGPGETGESPNASGDIRSRDDVIRAIDRICAYYDRAEPGSPIPLLLKRAKGLVSLDALGWVSELLPEALANLRTLGGVKEEK